MCGIAGIFNSNKSIDELYSIGKKMVSQMHHRGPDASGIKILFNENSSRTLFSHTRLSILDLTHNADQPMSYENEKLWIVFNGEIYNFKEIREELKLVGFQFKTSSDTELILAAYTHWGLKCFERFVGMWAIALWDKKNNTFILSRDRLGVKPLYYYINNKEIYFGSEPKVIVDICPECKKADLRAISDYFSYRYVLDGGAFFSKIKSLQPGCHLVYQSEQFHEVKYWDLPVVENKKDYSDIEATQIMDEALERAVQLRMIADVPVGSFLSGGLDSSILVSIMSKYNPGVNTFSIGFKEDGYNEFEFAREVADHCKTTHHEILLDADQYLNSLSTMIKIKDAPLAVPNEIALHILSKKLKEHVTVVLSGEGADELFGGYGRIFRSAYDYQRWTNRSSLPNPEFEKSIFQKYATSNLGSEVEHFLSQYSYVDFNVKNRIFPTDILSSLDGDPHNVNFFSKIWKRLDGLDLHEKYMWIFQKVHLQGLLGRLDSATMSASVEGRVPFVDHILIEKINALPLNFKMRWNSENDKKLAEQFNSNVISEKYDTTKYILRNFYEKKLPKRISTRKKVGFPVPLGHWLSGPLKEYAIDRLLSPDSKTSGLFNRDYVQDILESANTSHSKGHLVWMMVNVEDWMREYSLTI